MHIPRFIIDTAQITQGSLNHPQQVTLRKEQSSHLNRVLRRGHGSMLELLLRETECLFSAVVAKVDKQSLCEIVTTLEALPAEPAIHILLGRPKSKSLEQVVQLGTEIGVSSFLLFPAEHSPIKQAVNLNRLASIRDSAVEQARLGHIPKIHDFASIKELIKLRTFTNSHKILATSPNEAQLHPSQTSTFIELFSSSRKKLENAHTPLEKPKENVEIYIAVGPEGGFSSREIAFLHDLQFQRASLGPYVARVETAVVLAVGISRLAA